MKPLQYIPVNPFLAVAPREPPHTPNGAELHRNGLKPLVPSATTLRVTHPFPSLKAPSAAHVLFSVLKHCVAQIPTICPSLQPASARGYVLGGSFLSHDNAKQVLLLPCSPKPHTFTPHLHRRSRKQTTPPLRSAAVSSFFFPRYTFSVGFRSWLFHLTRAIPAAHEPHGDHARRLQDPALPSILTPRQPASLRLAPGGFY